MASSFGRINPELPSCGSDDTQPPAAGQCGAGIFAGTSGLPYIRLRGTEVVMSAFDEGVVAAETGMRKDDNPYEKATQAHSDWDAGYDSAVEAHRATELDSEWSDFDPTAQK
jgi:hypothetical protein